MKKFLSLILSIILTFALFTGCDKKENKVILISIDGLRADAVTNTEYGNYLIENSAYSLEVTTVMPSITLPCHTSMFYGVTPDVHEITSNVYNTSTPRKNGICETLKENDKTSALFYNWEEISYVATEGTTEISRYIPGSVEGWETSNEMLYTAFIEYLTNNSTDFAFLYLGFLDENGHKYGWLTEEYYYALNKSFNIVEKVVKYASDNGYTVIITSDHGGHDKGHGLDLKEDMTIPLFIVGDNYEKGRNLEKRSILDIAPTVTNILGVSAPDYWQGTAIK